MATRTTKKKTSRRKKPAQPNPIQGANLAQIKKQRALVRTLEVREQTAIEELKQRKSAVKAARSELDEMIDEADQGKLNFA